jgi:hypothetical protein
MPRREAAATLRHAAQSRPAPVAAAQLRPAMIALDLVLLVAAAPVLDRAADPAPAVPAGAVVAPPAEVPPGVVLDGTLVESIYP